MDKLKIWPNFFIVGAPRAGTTSLYQYLKETSGVYMSPRKEPNYFTSINPSSLSSPPIKDEKKYLKLFSKVKYEKAIGEASPNYLRDPKSPELIHNAVPNSKIIIILRDPVERAYSSYLLRLSSGKTYSFSQAIKQAIEPDDDYKTRIINGGIYFESIQRFQKIFYDAASGLKAIIAIHDTTRGPALGGCRMWPYASEDEALTDALRLARGMTFKSALADLPYGGGKSVIIGDSRTMKSEALFLAMGRFVDTLDGRYVIAEDVGISVDDVEVMARATSHVAGTRSAGAGDPSPATAHGVLMGIRAAVAHKLGRDNLNGVHVAVQGLGNVGYHLCRGLTEAGAHLTVSDIDTGAVARACTDFSAESVAPEAIYDVAADVFAPCALGAVIDDQTIPRLQARVIAGSANNQLAEPRHGAA